MSSSYQKTAKDLAWDKERSKLGATIRTYQNKCAKLNSMITERDANIEHLKAIIQEQHSIIEELQNLHDLSDEDIRALVENRKKQNQAIDVFDSLVGLAEVVHKMTGEVTPFE